MMLSTISTLLSSCNTYAAAGDMMLLIYYQYTAQQLQHTATDQQGGSRISVLSSTLHLCKSVHGPNE